VVTQAVAPRTGADARLTGLLPSGQPYDYSVLGWENVYGFATAGAGTTDKAYLTGTAAADTLIGYGMPRASNSGRLYMQPTGGGTAYFFETWRFDEVYADMAGGADSATLLDSTGNDTAFLKATDAVLSDGTLDLNTGDLLAAGNYYYKLSGLSKTGGVIDDLVQFSGAAGGSNDRKRVDPVDYTDLWFGAWNAWLP
jgi:Ca2+-binding RTX toxin-like protein